MLWGGSRRKDELKLRYLTSAMTTSRTSGKSTYATCLRFFPEPEWSRNKYAVEVFLAYWLSWFILSSDPDVGLNHYVFELVILLAKGRNGNAPLYLRSL